MASRRKYTLAPGTVKVLESMGVKTWIHEGDVRHNAHPDIRLAIKENIERVRETGVRGSALFFGACLLTAMDRDTFTLTDIERLDPMGKGNAGYILEKMEGHTP